MDLARVDLDVLGDSDVESRAHAKKIDRRPRRRLAARAGERAGAGASRASPDRVHRQELREPRLPRGSPRRRGDGQGAFAQARDPHRGHGHDASRRGSGAAGAARRPDGETGRPGHRDLRLRGRHPHEGDQRGGGQGDRGHDLRRGPARIEALRPLRRGRRQGGGDGARRAGGAARGDGQGGHPGREPRRPEHQEAGGRGQEGGSGPTTPPRRC